MAVPHPRSLDAQLRHIIRRGRVMTAEAQLAGYDADGLGYRRFRPDAVVIPADRHEVCELMAASGQFELPIVVRGAGTSLSGGPVAAQGGIIVHTSALRSIGQICRDGLWCEVEAGVTLAQLEQALAPHGLFYPPDPSSGMVCTLGGNVAMNAGGAHCFRYGVTGNYVLGVEAVMLDGSIHRFGGPAGGRGHWQDDWKRLMVGSEGTLGAFLRFWLRLLPRPEKAWTLQATFADLNAAEAAIHALVRHSSFPVAIELMDPRCVALVENSPMAVGLPPGAFVLITEIDGPTELVDSRVESVAGVLAGSHATAVDYSDDPSVRQRLWRARKAAGGLMGQLSADLVVQDAVIPKSALGETLQLIYRLADEASIAVINVFHAGDGNLHPNFMFDSRQPGELAKIERINHTLMKWVIEIGGTLSGEHGIGNDKAAYMPWVFGTEGLKLQRAVPGIFNAGHQLNPLKVFTSRRYQSPSAGDPQTMPGVDRGDAKPIKDACAAERLFQHFIDPVDALACVSADAKLSDFAGDFERAGLRFPLVHDPDATLREHVMAESHAPASSRFGPWCDNMVGMNWRFPGGKVVRVGERVVKSTTGYDLLRFLLAAGDRYGRATEYVIRLRPAAQHYRIFQIRGAEGDLIHLASELVQSDWSHWLDSVDWGINHPPTFSDTTLRVVAHLPDLELDITQRHIESLVVDHRSSVKVTTTMMAPHDRLPAAAFKVSPDQAIRLATEIAARFPVGCVAACCVGAIAIYNPSGQAADEVLAAYREQVEAMGGEWRSRRGTGGSDSDSVIERTWQARFQTLAGVE